MTRFAIIASSAMSLVVACGSSKPVTTATGTSDTAVAAPVALGVPCTQEIARVCPAGEVDGCSNQLTTVHACIATTTTAAVPCEQEIAAVCGEGLVDACTTKAAATHICVRM